MANIRDIAKITGYSVSTISRVINNHPYVDDEKRAKVLQVMSDLNYVPNRSAQNLSYGRTKNIGVILPLSIMIIMIRCSVVSCRRLLTTGIKLVYYPRTMIKNWKSAI